MNFRQYGLGIELYAQQYRDHIPTEGVAEGDTTGHPLGPWDDRSFWANAIPGQLNEPNPPYYELQTAFAQGQTELLPGAGSKSIFCCASAGPAQPGQSVAETDGKGHFMMWGLAPGSINISGTREQRPTYWSYVYNSGLDNIAGGSSDAFGTRHLRLVKLNPPSSCVIMVETMMDPKESKRQFNGRLNRIKTKGNDWDSCRLTARHDQGGNLLFADGHVGHLSREEATTDVAGDGTYNRPGVTWQPGN
ncbi:MAG: hypothetical protein QM783_02550 [Phycisphaerales bacterium]